MMCAQTSFSAHLAEWNEGQMRRIRYHVKGWQDFSSESQPPDDRFIMSFVFSKPKFWSVRWLKAEGACNPPLATLVWYWEPMEKWKGELSQLHKVVLWLSYPCAMYAHHPTHYHIYHTDIIINQKLELTFTSFSNQRKLGIEKKTQLSI